jgi:hypothetical protein
MRLVTARSTLSVIALTLSASHAAADVMTFQQGVGPSGTYAGSTAATIRSDNPNNNYGGDVVSIVGKTVAPATIRSVFGFDVSSIPDGATINSVTFRLFTDRADTAGSGDAVVPLELYQVTGTFSEGAAASTGAANGSVSWNFRGPSSAAWTTAGGDFSPTPLGSTSANPLLVGSGTIVDFVGTAGFVSALQSASDVNGTLSLLVKSSPATEAANAREIFFFRSDEHTNTATRPMLLVDYTPVPEPTTTALLAAGGAALLLRRRRQTP